MTLLVHVLVTFTASALGSAFAMWALPYRAIGRRQRRNEFIADERHKQTNARLAALERRAQDGTIGAWSN